MRKDRTIAVTGIGIVCPLGTSRDATWSALLGGKSGIGPIRGFDASNLAVRIAAEVPDFAPERTLGKKLSRTLDRFTQLALLAADEAVAESGMRDSGVDPGRIGAVVATGLGGLLTIEEEHCKMLERGPGRVSPFFVPKVMPNAATGQVAIRHGFQGPNFATASACAASAHALACAALLIQSNQADAILAGGAEAIVSPLGMAGFIQIKALSRRNDEPEKASRPFDLERDGFVMGEGAAALMLEDLEHAKRRGAPILAIFDGFGMTDDAHHITAPASDGEGAIRAMRLALSCSGWDATSVDYINCHGTSTKFNDAMEALAIRRVFGDQPRLAMSSTKAQTGHLIGAAGAVEAALSVLALRNGVIPATTTCENLDPDCGPIDVVPGSAREADIRRALSNSFGFGGHNITLAFSRFDS